MPYLIKEEYFYLMKKICYKNLRNVCTQEEMDSLIYLTYVKCLKSFNPTKSDAKFTTFLYHSISKSSRSHYKKIKKYNNQSLELLHNNLEAKSKNKDDVYHIIESLKEKNKEFYEIIVDKYIYNKTNSEIGDSNGYSKETARKKLKQAIELCRQIVYN